MTNKLSNRPADPPAVSTVGRCVIASVLLCVFEGAARKWLLPNSSPAVQAVMYFSKDIPLAFAFYLTIQGSTRAKAAIFRPLGELLAIGTFLFIIGALGAFTGMSPKGAVVTVRNGLLLPWVAYVIAKNLRGKADVAAICHTVGACAVLNAVLGGMQFFLPPGHILNRQITDAVEVIGDVGRIRASGTFSFLNGMGDLCFIAVWAGCVLIGADSRRLHGYIYIAAGLACSAEAMTRGGILMGFVLLTLVLISNPRLRIVGIGLAFAVVVGSILADRFFKVSESDDPAIHTAILKRHKKANDTVSGRALAGLTEDLPNAIANVPMGVGLGRGQPAAQASANVNMVYQMSYPESELGRVVYETGLIGFLGIFAIRMGLPLLLWGYRPNNWTRLPAVYDAVFWPSIWLMALFINSLIVFNHIQATFQAVALICALGTLEQVARFLKNNGH